ncbi:VOC family protein [Rhodococcus sp. BGS-1C]|uniref:VOC family protein n=1 Tax=unclassified Rhodococcus (in: high G+C Gram-positive bacteria) TaxID=192944 RepID=UPI0019D176B0|nr:VOC family protein [Rhodococcus sp. KRD197]
MNGSRSLVAFAASTDLARSERFYVDVIGLTVVDRNPFAIVFDGEGAQLRVTAVDSHTPAPFTVLGWELADIDTGIAELITRGAVPIRYDGMEQDSRGVWTAPGGMRVAWFHDPDRNVLSYQSRA